MSSGLTKLISLFISFCLILEQSAFAQSLDLSAHFANFGRSIVQTDKFRPLHLRYLGYDNLKQDFKLLLDKGDTKKEDLENKAYIEENTQTLLKYFFIGLTLPNDKFWVNLRPDSPENILDPDLEKTDIGRIFLEADLQLKKDTAQWTSPQTPEGKVYWDKLYKKAGELFGTENITIPTITRPWIVPNEIIIRESTDDAYIYKATLKVMLEEDYLKSPQPSAVGSQPSEPNYQPLTTNYSFSDPRMKELNQYSTQLIKEQILPKLTYEVNTAKRYAQLRQVYYSLILAQWFKARYRSLSPQSTVHSPQNNPYIKLIDSRDLTNLASKEPYDKQTYFKQYQKSFKDGEYNLSEPVHTPMGQSIRRYMSGGLRVALEIHRAGTIDPSIVVIPAITATSSSSLSSFLNFPWPFSRETKSDLGKGEVVEINYNKPIDIIIFPGTDEETKLTVSSYDDLSNQEFKEFLAKDIGYAIIQEGVTREDFLDRGGWKRRLRPKGLKGMRNKEVVRIGEDSNPKIEDTRSKIDIFKLPRESPEELIRIERDGDKIIITNLGLEPIKIITKKASQFRKLNKDEYRPQSLILLEDIYGMLQEKDRYSLQRTEHGGIIHSRFGDYGVIVELKESSEGYIISVGEEEEMGRIIGALKKLKGISYEIKSRILKSETLDVALRDKATKEKKYFIKDERNGGAWMYNDEKGEDDVMRVAKEWRGKYNAFVTEVGLRIIQEILSNIEGVVYSVEKASTGSYQYEVVIQRLLKGYALPYEIYVDMRQGSFSKPDSVNPEETIPPKTKSSSSLFRQSLGGIDFTHLPIVTQAITNLGSSPLRPSSYSSLRQLKLSEEYQAIERLASSSITPSPERLKGYLQASCLQDKIGEERDNALGLLASVLRDEESSLSSTKPELLDILVALEASTSLQQLKEIFLGKN